MEIESLCPFPVATLLWEPQPGDRSLTVCVKATYALVPGGTAEIAAEQMPVCEETLWDSNPTSSLYAPSDFAPIKLRADVILVGHAYAPGGAPVESLVARMRAGGLSKSLHVTGDRVWVCSREGLQPGPAAAFVTMPLRYERASMGPDNPIGIDAAPERAQVGWPVPNIFLADETEGDERAAGFGPIPAAWRAQAHFLSEASTRWALQLRSRPGPGAAPGGFDFGFFNAAPPDQQIESLPAALKITLENLSPTHPRLETRLPPIQPKAFRVSKKTGLSYEIPLRCDTLYIDSDRGLAVVSWRGSGMIPSGDEESLGRLVITTDKHPEPLVASSSAGSVAAAAEPRGAEGRVDATMSVAQGVLRSADARPLPTGWIASVPALSGQGARSLEGLPFQPVDDPSATVPLGTRMLVRGPALPFKPPVAGRIEPGPAPAPPSTGHLNPSMDAGSLRTPAAISQPPAPAAEVAPAKAAKAAQEPEAPIAMNTEPDGASIESCAMITAEISDKRTARDEILRAHGLNGAAWTSLERRWMTAIADETKRGSSELLNAFDAAYVATVERLRGPITTQEYARLAVGVERGDAGPALASLGIQRSALMRIQRVWRRMIASDPELAAQLNEALRVERKR